ncbi:MAG: 1-phosphofructokinase family hexose kinase [Candidatus Adiutrix sp.]
MRALTITLNPAINQTIETNCLVPGKINQALSVHKNAGGKGVNVAAYLADWGFSVTVTGFLGVDNESIFEKLFEAQGIQDQFVRLKGSTRTNIKIIDKSTITYLNLPGLPPSEQELQMVKSFSLDWVTTNKKASVVLSGSLPQSCPENIYAQITEELAKAEARVFLDSSGGPLAAVLGGAVMPFCIKPNLDELSQWAQDNLNSREKIINCVQTLLHKGLKLAVVSLGGDGALFISRDKVLAAKAEGKKEASTLGAGDAMVAGLVAAVKEKLDLEHIARLSTAFAVTKMGLIGSHLPPRHIIEQKAREVVIS